MFVFKAAVVGAGTMGGQIAQTIAAAGIPVVLKDVRDDLVQAGLDEARNVTHGQVSRLTERGKLTDEQGAAQVEEIAGRIHGVTTYEGFGDVDFVIEAVPERMEIKQTVFAELDEVTPGHAILSSNTSSLSITEMGDATNRPHKVVGFHFFYPASMLRLIEVIEGEETSEDTMQSAAGFAQQIRKQPIRCGEAPGFVVNRILNSSVSEVWRVRDEEDLDVKDVDKIVSEAGAAPMGPFYLADMLGLDTVLHVAEHLRASFGDRFYVSPAMKELVEAGNYGQKTGKGFYEHG
jgi:3-hydroxyacyl-CoA dehydrogenase